MATSRQEGVHRGVRAVVLAPRGLDYKLQFTGPTGANAVEAALKLARKVDRPLQRGGVHQRLPRPVSLGSLAATGNSHYRERRGRRPRRRHAPALRRLLRRGASTRSTCSRRCSTTRARASTCPRRSSSRPCRPRAASTSRAAAWLQRLARDRRRARHPADRRRDPGRRRPHRHVLQLRGAGIVPDIVMLSKSICGLGPADVAGADAARASTCGSPASTPARSAATTSRSSPRASRSRPTGPTRRSPTRSPRSRRCCAPSSSASPPTTPTRASSCAAAA